ncbi:MAG TPA: adenylate/guanylate cyclase domain-containing protein [Chitinophagales bacterium]|nr:adenylate/guanylate cyclase domain-containing protein [Chitinophagales bacterium]
MDACLAVRERINVLPAIAEMDSFKPQVSIGIKSGEMISGNIGSANLKRLDYTVIGDIVNTAQRLQSIAEPRNIIISENSYEK